MLGWWRPVLTDDRPVRRWVRVIPVIIAVAALAGMNYLGLGKHSFDASPVAARVYGTTSSRESAPMGGPAG